MKLFNKYWLCFCKFINKKKIDYPIFHFYYFVLYRCTAYFLKTKHYKISIIIPCHNSESHITQCLKSLEKLSHHAIEIIIIDDASTDNTVEIINKFQKDTTLNIKLHLSEQKIGVAKARNIGINLARGEYITFQDSDDVCHPYRITFQLCGLLLHKHKKIALCLYYRHSNLKPIRINHKIYKKCIISMMFLRTEIIAIFGGMSDIKIGSDSEFRERIIAYYGTRAEIIVYVPLYFAHFSPKSHFFSECTDITYANNSHIIYNESNIHANHALITHRTWHHRIKTQKISPHIADISTEFI
jgi:glycosyltransferase involved in cell wall biosynthesis